jgi:gag-polypeptide of LTR copia-type/Integrase core domain
METSLKISIDRLNETNYFMWARRMRTQLVALNLWTDVERVNANIQQASKALAYLEASIEDSVLVTLPNAKTAKKLWEELESKFSKVNDDEIVRITERLAKTKLDDCSSIEDYLRKLQQLFQQLEGAGQTISANRKFTQVLSGLPKRFEQFKIGMSTIEPAHKTFENAGTRLKAVIDLIDGDLEEKNSVMLIGTNSRKYACSKCRMDNHSTSECWYNGERPKRRFPTNQHYSAQRAKRHNDHVISLQLKLGGTKDWILDGGASVHVTWDKSDFDPESYSTDTQTTAQIADGSSISSIGHGNVTLKMRTSTGDTKNVTFTNVKHMPESGHKIISEIVLESKGVKISKHNGVCRMTHQGEVFILKRENSSNELYKVENAEKIFISQETWHKRIGHAHIMAGSNPKGNKSFPYLYNATKGHSKCETCILAKSSVKPIAREARQKASEPLQTVHSDICGPISPETATGKRYFLNFVDDCTGMCWTFLLNHKSEQPEKFRAFQSIVEKQSGYKIKTLHSDNGGEYKSKQFSDYLANQGILQKFTSPHSPFQNGNAERMNRTYLEAVRCMLIDKSLPKYLWGEAVLAANHVRNRLPKASLNGISPYEAYFGKTPTLDHLRVFGCICYVHIQPCYKPVRFLINLFFVFNNNYLSELNYF